MNLNKIITFLFILVFLSDLNFLLSKNIKIINDDTNNFNFDAFFEDPIENHQVENIILTIGLPSNKTPKIIVSTTEVIQNNDLNFNQFYKPIENYAKWERIERYRNLNIGILIISPTKTLVTNNYAKKLNINIQFEENLQNINNLKSSFETEIYKNKILNWKSAKNWIKNNTIKLNKILDNKSILNQNISGDWYKIYIENDGVYKLDNNELMVTVPFPSIHGTPLFPQASRIN